MKSIKVVLVLFALLSNSFLCAQKVMKRPVIFTQTTQSNLWDDVVSERNWGKLSDKPWKVYADRDDVEVYEQPSLSCLTKKRRLNFLEPVWIAEIKEDFAHVYKTISTSDMESLSGEIGWVEIDKLLLWDRCPMTENLIYKKAIILTNLSKEGGKSGKADFGEEIHLYNSPGSKKPNSSRISELEFYFVYKYSDGYALLMRTEEVEKSGQDSRGWTNKFTFWNSRICFEPNWELGASYDIVVFDDKFPEQAREYMQTGVIDYKNQDKYKYVWHEKLSSKRWPINLTRLPKLKDAIAEKFNIEKVGTISNIKGNIDSDSRALKKEIEERIKKINIVIVMDGTMSMETYYPQMCKAIQRAMNNIQNQRMINTKQVKFGAVIYRNEEDGSPKVQPLTTASNVIKYLSNHKCGSISSNPYEAMFEGLYSAVKKIDWNKQESNFIILVGDAASDIRNRLNLNVREIGQSLASQNINFVAFQANHGKHKAYADFIEQIDDILMAEASEIYGRNITVDDFIERKNAKYLKVKEKEEQQFPMKLGFVNAAVGKNGQAVYLENLIVQNIDSFITIQQRQLDAFDSMLDRIQKTGGELNVDILTNRRDISPEQIEKWRKYGTALNVDGYTSSYIKGRKVLLTSVFLTNEEYTFIVDNLKAVATPSPNRRKSLQDALVKLGQAYIGEKDIKNMDINDLLRKIFDLGDIDVFDMPGGLTIKDITDSSVDISIINDIIKKTDQEVKKFELESAKSMFMQNGLPYYYIPIWDMPFQKH